MQFFKNHQFFFKDPKISLPVTIEGCGARQIQTTPISLSNIRDSCLFRPLVISKPLRISWIPLKYSSLLKINFHYRYCDLEFS